jgi:predicted 3-demethylubiquinone-9 3-methyltransferase (glyoxalase superfamily)
LEAAGQSCSRWLAFGIDHRNTGESGAVFRRVSDHPARSAGVGWCCSRYGLVAQVSDLFAPKSSSQLAPYAVDRGERPGLSPWVL